MAARKQSPLEIKAVEVHMCTIPERLKILQQVPFFQGLLPADLEQVNSIFHQHDYRVDEVICFSGEPAKEFFVVADGRVRLLRHSLIGKEILLDLLTQGEFFGALSGMESEVYPDTAQAQSDCCVLTTSRKSFQQILQRQPTVAMKVIEIMSKRLQSANERLHQLSVMPIEGRIASILLLLGRKFGEKSKVGLLLQVPLSREDLAGMTGTTTESASRVMSQFQKDGLIRSGRGWAALTNLEGLETIAGNELE